MTVNEGLDDPELVAFCALWILMERCMTDPKMGKSYRELFKLGREHLVAILTDFPKIQDLLAVSRMFYEQGPKYGPAFSLRDHLCEGCPLEKGLRDLFCSKYRQEAARELGKEGVEQRLWEAYHTDFRQFLTVCFEAMSWTNLSASYCLAKPS